MGPHNKRTATATAARMTKAAQWAASRFYIDELDKLPTIILCMI